MNKLNNSIVLSRAIMENFLWNEKPFSPGQAWIDLLMLAEWRDRKVLCKGRVTVLHRGQVGRSILWLSDRWGWSRGKTQRFLDVLKSDNMIVVNSTTGGTTITVENYDRFQFPCATGEPTNGQQTGQQADTSKEYKEIKKQIPTVSVRGTIPPTLEMVRAYCQERNSSVDPERFCDFYQSKNWMVGKNKMKDWQAAVRNWEKRNDDNNKRIEAAAGDPTANVTERERESVEQWLARQRSRTSGT